MNPTLDSIVRRWRLGLVLPLALLLAACGGGGGGGIFASGGIVGTGDAALFASGVVTTASAGAITVNGIAFDVRTARVRINDQASTPASLRVGMVVSVQAVMQPDGPAVASSVEYRADVEGIVDGVDTTARAFTLLGVRVLTDATTVFEGGTFATLLNQSVEVSGLRAPGGGLLATRVEIRAEPVVQALRVSGTVSSLDPVARTFALGAQRIDYAALPAQRVPAALANGAVASVEGVLAGTTLVASSIEILMPPNVPDGGRLRIEGLVSDFASLASFRVDGQRVDASAATIEGGTADLVGNGARVEAEGRVRSGVLVATHLEIEQAASVTLDALVESIDASAKTLSLGGRTVQVQASTQFEDASDAPVADFSFATIAVGDRLVVRAQPRGGELVAVRVERRGRGARTDSDGPTTRVEGTILAFVSTSDFLVGTQPVNAASATFVGGTSADLREGRRVTVVGVLNGSTLLATRVTIENDDPGSTTLEIEGSITGFVSAASFRVAGQAVDASRARFSQGTAADLANGRDVTVRGVISGSTLIASDVEFHDRAPSTTTVELEGAITDFMSPANFRVEGQWVDATAARLSNGSLSDLANGRRVHVKGPLVSGVVRAATVEIEDAPDAEASAEGRITDFVSIANFRVAGRTIDASAAGFEHGRASDLANGREVHVEGRLSGTVLRASKVSFE